MTADVVALMSHSATFLAQQGMQLANGGFSVGLWLLNNGGGFDLDALLPNLVVAADCEAEISRMIQTVRQDSRLQQTPFLIRSAQPLPSPVLAAICTGTNTILLDNNQDLLAQVKSTLS